MGCHLLTVQWKSWDESQCLSLCYVQTAASKMLSSFYITPLAFHLLVHRYLSDGGTVT